MNLSFSVASLFLCVFSLQERPYIFTRKNSNPALSTGKNRGLRIKNYLNIKPNWEHYEKYLEDKPGPVTADESGAGGVPPNDRSLGKGPVDVKSNSPVTHGAVVAMLSLMVLAVVMGGVAVGVSKTRKRKSDQENASNESQGFDNPNYETRY